MVRSRAFGERTGDGIAWNCSRRTDRRRDCKELLAENGQATDCKELFAENGQATGLQGTVGGERTGNGLQGTVRGEWTGDGIARNCWRRTDRRRDCKELFAENGQATRLYGAGVRHADGRSCRNGVTGIPYEDDCGKMALRACGRRFDAVDIGGGGDGRRLARA